MIFYYCSDEYQEYASACDAKAVHSIGSAVSGDDIFVLFEQPMPDEEALLVSAGCTVFAHKGIRFQCRKFTVPSELAELIETEHRRRRQLARDAYIAGLTGLTEEEAGYLRETYKVECSGVHEAPLASSEASGKLAAYRGSNEGFAQLVRTLDKKMKNRRILLVDLDLFRPSFDSIFSVRRITTSEKTHLTGRDNTGLNVALELLSRKLSLDEIIRRTIRRRSVSVDMLLGNYNIFNIEHFRVDRVLTLISGMQQRYDLVIAKLSDFIFDELAMALTHRAQLNIFAVDGGRSNTRYAHQLYEVLTERQDIDSGKIHIYRTKFLQSPYLLAELFGVSYKGLLAKAAEKSLRGLIA